MWRRLLRALGAGAAVTATGYGLGTTPTWWTAGAVVAVAILIVTTPGAS